MRSDNLQLPCVQPSQLCCVQPPTSSYNLQHPHGRHGHHGQHCHGGHGGCGKHF